MGKQQSSLFRSLGQFAGHIARAVRTSPEQTNPEQADAEGTQRHETRRDVEEDHGVTPDGRPVTVRRTTIEELEIGPAPQRRTGEDDR